MDRLAANIYISMSKSKEEKGVCYENLWLAKVVDNK